MREDRPRGYTMAWIRFSGVRGRGWLRMALLPLELLVAFWQSPRVPGSRTRRERRTATRCGTATASAASPPK